MDEVTETEDGRKGANPPRPSSGTDAAARHFARSKETLSLFGFIGGLALHQDFAQHTLKKALDGEDADKALTPGRLAQQNPGPATKRLRRHGQALLEMILAREVENFTVFLSESIQAALAARPELLRSGREIRLDYVLAFSSIESLIEDLIDRKVSDLGYEGLDALDSWIDKHLGLKLLQDQAEAAVIREAIETRNVIVHARGLVGAKYLSKVPDSQFKRGDLRTLHVDLLSDIQRAMVATVATFDLALSEKFNLPQNALEESNMVHDERDDDAT